jgi:regulator of protease activity HflC (stomatin/prohibitin superfamily)
MAIPPALILFLLVVLYVISSIKILAEYERGVIFRLGKLLPGAKGPGVILVFAPIDRMVTQGLRSAPVRAPERGRPPRHQA